MKKRNAEARARALIAARPLKALVNDFVLTEKSNDPNIFIVRGWLLDELKKRNPEAFDKWLDESFEDEDLPIYFGCAI